MSDRQLRQPPNPYLDWRRCAECGQSEFDAWQEGREFGVRSERARYTELVEAAEEMVEQFYVKSHPGMPCLKTNPVRVTTVERWRSVLAALRSSESTVSPDGDR